MSSTETKAAISRRQAESIDRNLDLIRGYIAAQLEDVDNMEQVPEGAETVLLPDDDPEWFERNLEIVINSLRGGANVYARHVTKDGRPK
ncbi:MAG TPA: hypothetical protein VH482_17055 [Thermomicrobiales bacterium]|jgi:hypothetical protein